MGMSTLKQLTADSAGRGDSCAHPATRDIGFRYQDHHSPALYDLCSIEKEVMSICLFFIVARLTRGR